MEHPNTQRRAIGLLVIVATVLTVIAVWNLPERLLVQRERSRVHGLGSVNENGRGVLGQPLTAECSSQIRRKV
jgi:hypothetical protein